MNADRAPQLKAVVMRLVESRKKIIMIPAKLVSLLCLGLMVGLSHGQTKTLTEQPIPPDTLITLRRPNCFLTCPDYLVTISADGIVTFEGYANVKLRGKAQSQISREKLQMLVAAFVMARYFSLRDEYVGKKDGCRQIWPDADFATTSILINGKSKSVDHYLGCHRKEKTVYPEALTKLEMMIDEVANTSQWID